MSEYHYEMHVSNTDPDGMELRVVTDDPYISPKYKTCYAKSVGSSIDVNLTSAGETYFGDYASAVNDAIDAAIAKANTDAYRDGSEGDTCEDDCFDSGGVGGVVQGDVSAIIEFSTMGHGVPEGDQPNPDDPCQVDKDGQTLAFVPEGIRVQLSAPGTVVAIDLNDVLDKADTSKFTDPALAGSVLVALTNAGGIAEFDSGDNGYKIYVDLGSGAFARASLNVDVSAMDIVGKPTPSSGVTSTDGYLTFDDPITSSTDSTITAVSSMGGDSGITVGSVIGKILGDDRTIDETIPWDSVNSTNENYVPGSATTNVQASGSVAVSTSGEHKVMTDPGVSHTACIYTVSYLNRRPFKPLCGNNDMQLDVANENGYEHPPGKFPKCRLNLKAIDAEA